ncbi:hypothetical protein VTO73DRAFT_9167 [Trametes versicolor]
MSSRNPRSQPLFDSDSSHLAVDIRYQVILTSMACILYYDYFLTLKNEIALVWHSPRSLSKIFFLVIRYGFLLDTTLVLFYTLRITSDSGPTLTASSCKALYDAATIIQVSSFVAVSAFVALRISALWSHNWPLGLSLFAIGLFTPSITIPILGFELDMVPALWPMSPCVQTVIDVKQDPLIPLEIYDFPISASAVSIVYEFLCLTLTVVKTVGAYRVQRKMGMETTLSGLLLRDGSLYFAVLTGLGIFSVVAASIPESILPVDIGVIFARAFVPVLTTRFIVNLYQTGRHSSRVDTGTLSLWSFHVAQENGVVSSLAFSRP